MFTVKLTYRPQIDENVNVLYITDSFDLAMAVYKFCVFAAQHDENFVAEIIYRGV